MEKNEKIEYYNQFEQNLAEALLLECTQKGFADQRLLNVEELDLKWDEIAPEYLVHAIPEIAKYPTVAIAWAAYVGMGLAVLWDKNWEEQQHRTDLYESLVSPRGFDCMDEYIVEELLGLRLDSDENKQLTQLFQTLSEQALNMIRKENVEPQSIDAFQIYGRTIKVLFQIGVSVALKGLGYSYQKVTLS